MTRTTLPTLSVVVPVLNEQQTLPELYRRTCRALDAARLPFELVVVDDGSTDDTPGVLARLAAADPRVVVVRLSRNFGHQPAVSAGLDHAAGDAVVILDGDLQDPPEVIPELVARWRAGFDVVYAVRTRRKEGPVRRLGYFLFYRLLRRVADLDIPLDSGDFCLLGRPAADALRRLPERQRFVRGLRAFVGFRQTGHVYERHARAGGEPKYTLRKLAALAADGLIDFSRLPLRLVALPGAVATLAGGGLALWLAVTAVFGGPVAGWAAVLAAVLLVGGCQLLGLAVVGEYVRRIFLEAKGRPAYIVGGVTRTRAADPRGPTRPPAGVAAAVRAEPQP